MRQLPNLNGEDLSHLFDKKNKGDRFADYCGEEAVAKLVDMFNTLMQSPGGFIIMGTQERVVDAYYRVGKKDLLFITRHMVKEAHKKGLLSETDENATTD